MTWSDRELFEYLEEELPGSRCAQLQAALAESRTLQARLSALKGVLEGFRDPVEPTEGIDLLPAVR